MTRITNVDQVLLLLRSHLQRAERSRRKDASRKTGNRAAVRQTPLERVHCIANNEALSEHEIERALVSGVLAEEFGSATASDPKFQLMVDEVVRMLRQEPAGRMLLANAVGELIGGRK